MRFLKRHLYILLVTLILLTGLWTATSPALASDFTQEAPPVYIYFFWGDGCPHCADAKPFLQELAQRYPNVQVESFEVWYVAENQTLFQQMAEAHAFQPRYVPTFFIGDRQWEGFSDALRQEIEAAVQACVATSCPDAGVGVIPGREPEPELSPTAIPTPAPETSPEVCSASNDCDDVDAPVADAPPDDIDSTLIIFAAAFGAALLILLVHRVILPRFGIVIGTEKLD